MVTLVQNISTWEWYHQGLYIAYYIGAPKFIYR